MQLQPLVAVAVAVVHQVELLGLAVMAVVGQAAITQQAQLALQTLAVAVVVLAKLEHQAQTAVLAL
jgi:hypothetical protein